jgi:hypothetical protein
LIFTKRGIQIDEYPKIKNHLHRYYSKLKPQTDTDSEGRKPGTYKWFEIQDNIAYFQNFEQPKIIWSEISDFQKFVFDDKGFYTNNKCFIMTGERLKYLLAVLNSKASEWYFHQISTTTGMGTTMWAKYKIELLPIPTPGAAAERRLEALVERILAGKRAGQDTAALEAEVDVLVFQLYGLSPEEARHIEPGLDAGLWERVQPAE